MKVLLLGGKKNNGKSTIAKGIIKKDPRYCLRSFAAQGKRSMVDLGILLEEDVFGNQEVKESKSGMFARDMPMFIRENRKWDGSYELTKRDLMTVFMNDMLKVFNKSVHNDILEKVLKIDDELGVKRIVVDDFRFPEVETLGNIKDVTRVWVVDPDDDSNDSHASENSISEDDVDLIIINDKKDLEALTKNIEMILSYMEDQ